LLTMNFVAKRLFKFDFIHDLYREKRKSIKVIDGIKRRMSIFKLEQKIDSEIGLLYWFIMELLKITFLLEPLLLFSVIKELKNKNNDIENVFSFIGEIDQTISISYIRDDIWTTCIPKISNKTEILSKEMTHPLLFNCISNNFSCTDKSYLLTGSNMSGKTTFIRAIGLNCISAMTINTCFAQSFTLPYLKISTAIRITDDLQDSSSYFFNEVKAVKTIIDNSENEYSNLFLLDEIFKGTNTLERISSSKAILSYIAESNNFVFVSTHDIELTSMLDSKYDLYYFNESIEDNKIIFDYKLKSGIPLSGNAISILEMNDYPKEIIKDARHTIKTLL
jgi:DNA mismatch repair ATPase MutS